MSNILDNVGMAPQEMVKEPVSFATTAQRDAANFAPASFNNQAEVPVKIASGNIVSRALNRSAYEKTSVHNSTVGGFTLQVSNYPTPTEDDWYDVETGEFIHIEYPVKWIRIKTAAAVSQDELFYVQSALSIR